jgi:hypothetical protein
MKKLLWVVLVLFLAVPGFASDQDGLSGPWRVTYRINTLQLDAQTGQYEEFVSYTQEDWQLIRMDGWKMVGENGMTSNYYIYRYNAYTGDPIDTGFLWAFYDSKWKGFWICYLNGGRFYAQGEIQAIRNKPRSLSGIAIDLVTGQDAEGVHTSHYSLTIKR